VPMSERDEIRIVDPSSGADAVLDGEGRSRGELLCRGPYTVAGFLGAPEGACGIFDADGWYHSGDIVEHQMPDAGFGKPRLAVLGSCKPQINRGAEKIFPGRVESVLLRHPQVVEAKLIGVDDEVLGHATRAVVTVVPDETGRYPKTLKLRRFLHEAKLAAYYLPDSFEIHKRPADGEGALGATRRIDKEV
jgi:S-dihydroxybenzoyltransferase